MTLADLQRAHGGQKFVSDDMTAQAARGPLLDADRRREPSKKRVRVEQAATNTEGGKRANNPQQAWCRRQQRAMRRRTEARGRRRGESRGPATSDRCVVCFYCDGDSHAPVLFVFLSGVLGDAEAAAEARFSALLMRAMLVLELEREPIDGRADACCR